MKRACLFVVLAFVILFSCTAQEQNPFFSEWETPFGVPPFEEIENEHFMPAIIKGLEQHNAEIETIADNTEPPTFENTIEALDASGALLTRVGNVFQNLNSANTNEEMQEIAKETAPMISKHFDEIVFNEQLFERVKSVYDQREKLNLRPDQKKLLRDNYRHFVRGGANLSAGKKEELAKINEELSVLSLQFGENLLKENNRFEIVLESEEDLAGLPENVRVAAAEAAKERGHEGKWVFTLHKPSMVPFIQYSERRDLREKIFKAYINRGNNNDELDTKRICSRMAALRVKRAQILGYETHAHLMLEEYMAKKPANVYVLLEKLWKPALVRAKAEAYALQKMIYEEGGDFELEAWDWWYYAEKLKKAQYALDDEILRPYFELENVRQGIFTLCNKLWGITFTEIEDIPKYHEEVRVYEVKEADGSHIGLLYTDYHPRASKRGGAWMSEYRSQSNRKGKRVSPVITNVCNVARPTADTPALLNFDEVGTMFHEFGHALHGLLSNVTYEEQSGTAVAKDFVELPSQIMENWVTEPEMLKLYAKHYKTGEAIPQELVDKIEKARHFNQGFATTEYLAACFLDMDWHTLATPEELDALAFENKMMNKIGLIPEIVVRYKSYYFRHIFSGGYSSGYYSYIWAEVLDADAFQAFKETSIFDRETAEAFRTNILAAGGTEDPMTLYMRFRGAEPEIDPLLERRGLK